MKGIIFQKDRWWWEEIGVRPDRQWYWGDPKHLFRFPLSSWLDWIPPFRLRYPDKIAHAVGTMFVAYSINSISAVSGLLAFLVVTFVVEYVFPILYDPERRNFSMMDVLWNGIGAGIWMILLAVVE